MHKINRLFLIFCIGFCCNGRGYSADDCDDHSYYDDQKAAC